MSVEAKTIKLADVIDNTKDIVKNDKDFARRYIPEMEADTAALIGGNFKLLMRACSEVQKGSMILRGTAKKKKTPENLLTAGSNYFNIKSKRFPAPGRYPRPVPNNFGNRIIH